MTVKLVDRSELLGLAAYEQIRDHFRNRVIALKAKRRLQLGPHMSIVFENHDTVLLQIQEMLRTERITDERAIAHELETYNELIPRAGGLSATLFIEYDEPVLRASMLQRFAKLRRQIQFWVGDKKTTASFSTHFGEEVDRLPAVNYLSFDVGSGAASALRDSSVEAALEVEHPDYHHKLALPHELRTELAYELAA